MKKKRYLETGFRLSAKRKEELRAQGLHVYSRRDNGKESTIEPNVAVDFMGTLVTNFPIRFKKKGPDAYTIWRGDTYLKSVGAEEVHDISLLNRKKGGKR